MALLLSSGAVFAGSAFAAPAAKKLPAHCNDVCLTGAVNSYLAALVAHDPAQVPLSAHVEFVENTKNLKPGEGLWKTASAPPASFKIYVPDAVSEQVGFLGVMQSEGKPIMLGLRLKIRAGEIVAAEHLIASNLREASLKNLQETPKPFLTDVPASQRNSRADMIRIASMYYPALSHADANNAPFASDCVRHENGLQTVANPKPAKVTSAMSLLGSYSCEAQIKSGTFNYITRIEPVRVMIADPTTGLVFGLSQFRQPMKTNVYKLNGVPGYPTTTINVKPFDLPAAHVFKVYGGKIHQIEAMGFTMPYDSKTGWENNPDHGR
ncbi:MAG: hypothetical protein KGL02_03710 [Acidobacteriota bacterium]|nr:hypothetical protein [Acidobacteriota bacterium]MDE3171235.1 hypothetical protein [Acidobacteriota bacterium]